MYLSFIKFYQIEKIIISLSTIPGGTRSLRKSDQPVLIHNNSHTIAGALRTVAEADGRLERFDKDPLLVVFRVLHALVIIWKFEGLLQSDYSLTRWQCEKAARRVRLKMLSGVHPGRHIQTDHVSFIVSVKSEDRSLHGWSKLAKIQQNCQKTAEKLTKIDKMGWNKSRTWPDKQWTIA